jgi:hypothetical protein
MKLREFFLLFLNFQCQASLHGLQTIPRETLALNLARLKTESQTKCNFIPKTRTFRFSYFSR